MMASWGAKIAGFFFKNANSAGERAFSTSASTKAPYGLQGSNQFH
jgi:hypothetical protein